MGLSNHFQVCELSQHYMDNQIYTWVAISATLFSTAQTFGKMNPP